MSIEVIGILIILFLLIIGFIYIEPIVSKHKIKSDNEYGSARFSTNKEIKNNFTKEYISNIKNAGVPIEYSSDNKVVWFDNDTPHYVYLGSTGSGKSATVVIPLASFIATAKKKRSVFITDPKGEIFNATSRMFQENDYKVFTIDFRHPELSDKINILTPIINEYKNYINYEKLSDKSKNKMKRQEYNNLSMSSLAEANRLITSLAEMITSEKYEAKDPFWNDSAKNLLEGLIGFFLEEYKKDIITEDKITMTSIRKFQNSTMTDENLKTFKKYLDKKDYGTKSKDSLTAITSSADNTRKSIESVFGSKMAIFDDINVANVTSKSDFEFDILGKEPTALYIIVPDEDKTYYTLVTIIVGLIYRELVKLANKQVDKKLPIPIDWILDEFANCPPLKDIEAIVSVARSRRMRFHFFIQSFSQLDNVYGKNVSQIILDNCGLVYLKTNTQDTAEAISKRLGKKTIEANSISQAISLTNYNGNKSTSLIARDLMTPDEVKQLHYKTIIFPIKGYPILRKTVLYNSFSCYMSGCIERNTKYIKDLSNHYFVVENLNIKDKSTQDTKEFFKEKRIYDKKVLSKAEKEFKLIFGDKCKCNYIKIDENCVLEIVLNDVMNKRDKIMINNKINKEYYHLSYVDDKRIRVYLENVINNINIKSYN